MQATLETVRFALDVMSGNISQGRAHSRACHAKCAVHLQPPQDLAPLLQRLMESPVLAMLATLKMVFRV